jgi:predicted MFS family arabinose efflux permease
VGPTEGDADHQAVLGAVSLGNFAQIGARFVLSPLVPLVILEFGISKSSVGLVLTGMWTVYALGQFPSGVLADQYGERRLLITGLVGTAVGSGLIALAPSFLMFGAFTLLLGIGTGLFFSPAASLLSRLFVNDGKALGILTAAGAVAGVLYPAMGGLVGNVRGWRYAVGTASVVTVLVAVAVVRWIPRSETPARRDPDGIEPGLARVRALVTRPAVLYSTGLAVVFGFAFQSIVSFFPTFLQEYHGLGTGTAGIAFGGLFALSSLAQPVIGSVSDTVSRDGALALTAVTSGSALLVLLTVQGPTSIVLGTAVLGGGMSWPGVVQARLMDQLSDDGRGFGYGFLRTGYMFLAASGSVVVGTLVDVSGWRLGYGIVVGLFGGSLLVLAGSTLSRRDL